MRHPFTLGILILILGACFVLPAFAAELETYDVKRGDTLYGLSQRFYGSVHCWPLLAAYPTNNAYYPKHLWAGYTLTIPDPSECATITNPIDLPEGKRISLITTAFVYAMGSDPDNMNAYPDPSIRTSRLGIPAPFLTKAEVTSRGVMTSVRENQLRNSLVPGEWDYTDSYWNTRDGKLVWRARLGSDWYVRGGALMKNLPWDYVDSLSVSPRTDTVTYRARDKQGRWYMVKNDEATLLSFEPRLIFLNEPLDEPFAFSYSHPQYVPGEKYGITRVYSEFGDWQYSQPVMLKAVDAKGNLLFQSADYSDVVLKGADGEIIRKSDSLLHQGDFTYWLNGTNIGTATLRMYPLYSRPGAWGWDKGTVTYSGVVVGPHFNANDDLVLYTILNGQLKRHIYDVDHLKTF